MAEGKSEKPVAVVAGKIDLPVEHVEGVEENPPADEVGEIRKSARELAAALLRKCGPNPRFKQ